MFRVVGTVALGGYFLALIQDSIWYRRSWATTARYLLDGFIYAIGGDDGSTGGALRSVETLR